MMHRLIASVAVTIALAAPALPAKAAEKPRIEKLPNGITLILHPEPAAAGADLTVWYRTGAADEPPGKTGLTHLIEQLMFARTPGARVDHLAAVQAEGGTAGTHSTHDYTSFWQTVPPEALERVMSLEAARMRRLDVDATQLADVRERVAANRERVSQSPVVQGLVELFGLAFAGDGYAWPTIGRAEDMAGIDAKTIEAWHAERYGPANAVVTVTGRFDARDARKWMRATLGKVEKRGAAPVAAASLSPQTAMRRVERTYDFVAPAVFIGWRVDGIAGKDVAALDVIARMLAGSPLSALQQRIVGAERLAAFVQGGLELRARGGLLHATAVLAPGSDTLAVRTVEEGMVAEARRLAEAPDATTFEAAKREARLQHASGQQRVRDRAMAIGVAHLTNGASASERGEALAAVTLDQIREVAGRLFVPERLNVVWMMPQQFDGEGGGR